MSLKIENKYQNCFLNQGFFSQGYKDVPTKVLTKGNALYYLNKHYIVRHEGAC